MTISNGEYKQFLSKREIRRKSKGFEPISIPDWLFDFQAHLTEWAIRMGRAALFEDCGLGKTPQALVWGDNVVRHTNKPVLVIAPLAVSRQFVQEGEKFGINVHRTQEGTIKPGINVTNYERLKYFDPNGLAGVVADESSILKNIDGVTRKGVTEFCSRVPYCLLCTATPSPNDYMELGSSSEALGIMKHGKMLGTFFTNSGSDTQQWTLKGHAARVFWRWVASWSRAIRKPSDLGFDDAKFVLPGLRTIQHTVATSRFEGFFPKEAMTLGEQRSERRETLASRCDKVAELVPKDKPFIAWCHLNIEGDLLQKLIPGAVQVKGSDREEVKEDRLWAFTTGQIRAIVTKPTIAGFGLNWQHCSDISFFPHHSHEQFYQALRRCYRFGQKREVVCNIVTSEGEGRVLNNMLRKEKLAQDMYDGIIREMRGVLSKEKDKEDLVEMEVPEWL